MYRYFFKPILFLFDPEKVHHFIFSLLRIGLSVPGLKHLVGATYKVKSSKLQRELFGLTFPNPVGLAAGFDKNGLLINQMEYLGFGFVEVGTITPKPQDGNPKPRLFRLKKDAALINRMGFNNHGVDVISKRLAGRKTKIIVGGNIGKNTLTDNNVAEEDYLTNYRTLHPYVDYFVVNVSCPNIGNVQRLNDKSFLVDLLLQLKELNKTLGHKPILLKIGPDRTDAQLDEVIEIIEESGIDGVISTNTATDRSGLQTDANTLEQIGNGGLSGKPLRKRSTEVIRYLSEKSNKAFPIIGVGGIHSAEDALEKIEAGADLVQVYTGFVYEGPALVKRINLSLLG